MNKPYSLRTSPWYALPALSVKKFGTPYNATDCFSDVTVRITPYSNVPRASNCAVADEEPAGACFFSSAVAMKIRGTVTAAAGMKNDSSMMSTLTPGEIKLAIFVDSLMVI